MLLEQEDFTTEGLNSLVKPNLRMRRLRADKNLRELVKESRLSPKDLIHPLFVHHGKGVEKPIASLRGHSQRSPDKLNKILQAIDQSSLPAVILFGIPDHKDARGSSSWKNNGVVQESIKRIKDNYPNLLVIADLCFCQYTDHGHCGVLKESRGRVDVDNDETLELLQRQAVSLCHAGADVIAPSGMMDGMVAAIRSALDKHSFSMIPILSYSAKYSTVLYGPFRAAASSNPGIGDRKGYQMDPANGKEALQEVALDIQEGADMIMVKPAAYLDVIYRIKEKFPTTPLAAYQVGGEYAMIEAAAQNGWLNRYDAMMESLISIKRAGADMIISYFALDAALSLQNKM